MAKVQFKLKLYDFRKIQKNSSSIFLGGGDGKAKKKESILDLSKYLDKEIRVKFQGGREAQGVLKG